MPTYDYRCPDGHTFERRLKMSEAASELECPVCGKMATRQLSGGAGLVFKGSGFYLTDYGKNAHRGNAADGANSGSRKSRESSDGESKSTSNDSKPAEAKASESQSADAKSGDAKPAESKSSEKSSEKSSAATNTSTKKSDS